MSEQWGGSTPSGTGTNDTSSTATAAKDEASNVAQTASQSGQQVAGKLDFDFHCIHSQPPAPAF